MRTTVDAASARNAVLRSVSLLTLACVAGLYYAQVLPAWASAVFVFLGLFLGYASSRTRLRLLPLLLFPLPAFGFFAGAIALFPLVGSTALDRAYLHLRVASPVAFAVVCCCYGATILYRRVRAWRAIEPIVFLVSFGLVFWSQAAYSITIVPHPIYATLLAIYFAVMQIAQFIRRRNRAFFAGAFAVFVALSFIALKIHSAMAVSNNGGLIRPTLLQFDFSPYLSLKDEIKVNDTLVLILHAREEHAHQFLRRLYLSGWDRQRGFYERKAPGETPPPRQLPSGAERFADPGFNLRIEAQQEYFIVNFDPTTFISMDYPVSVTPYRMWDAASFNGGYAAVSKVMGFAPFELRDAKAPRGLAGEGISPAALSFYTEIDEATRTCLEPIAREATASAKTYYDTVVDAVAFFRDGEYRYSLKPGIAPDGDQLGYFLFTSKKGYCTYFAFSLCLALRSIGIPSRVAAGFFTRPDSGALGYYPVRANMAHAWVEVFFPRYGWVSFDPTTDQVASGEEIHFASNAGGDDFTSLLEEILSRREALSERASSDKEETKSGPIARAWRAILSAVKRTYPALIMLAIAATVFLSVAVAVRRRARGPRERVIELATKVRSKIKRRGYFFPNDRSRVESLRQIPFEPQQELLDIEQRARFAPEFGEIDESRAKDLARTIYRELPANHARRKKGIVSGRFFSITILAAALAMRSTEIFPEDSSTMDGWDDPAVSSVFADDADALHDEALRAIEAENWERTISLLRSAEIAYPKDGRFPFELAQVYLHTELYDLAYERFLRALALGFSDPAIFFRLSDTASLLNRDEEALTYLRRYLEAMPDDSYAWSTFGWLCYKTRRIDEGIETLLDVIGERGADGNIYVSLGNLYTAAFNYAEARRYYTLAIAYAEEEEQPYLASIYYYNRSILEETFYRFESAYEDSAAALRAMPRSSAYLMQGELELRRLDFSAAFQRYLKAYSLDSTPLASIGIADTLSRAGYPDQAGAHIEAIRRQKNLSWISSYGTTVDQYKADVYSIERDVERFRLRALRYRVVHNLSTFLRATAERVGHAVKAWYFDALFRIQNKRVARTYETSTRDFNRKNQQGLFANSYYYLSFSPWRRVSAPYLARAEAMETLAVEAARPSYYYERGQLLRDERLLDRAIETLNPVWERQYLERALAARLRITKKRERTLLFHYIASLYALNPAAFIHHDAPFAASLYVSGDRSSRRVAKFIRRLPIIFDDDAPFRIAIVAGTDGLTLSLQNVNTGRTIYTQDIHNSHNSSASIAQAINIFFEHVFQAPVGLQTE